MKITRKSQRSSKTLVFAVILLVAGMLVAIGATPAFALSKGETFVKGGNTYRIDEYDPKDSEGDVTLVKYGAKNTKPYINTIRYQGTSFQVEVIGRNAFNTKRGRRVVSVTLGRQVDRVQSKAFYGTKKLKVLNMGASDVVNLKKVNGVWKLDSIDAQKNAFVGAGAKALKVRCGKESCAYRTVYHNALNSKGLRKTARVVK